MNAKMDTSASEMNDTKVNISQLADQLDKNCKCLEDAVNLTDSKVDSIAHDTAKLSARVAQLEGAMDSDFGQPDNKRLRGAWNGKRPADSNPNRYGPGPRDMPPPPASAPPAAPGVSIDGKPNCARIQGFPCKYSRPDLEVYAKEIMKDVLPDDPYYKYEVRAGAQAKSILLEFLGTENAAAAIKIAASKKLVWTDEETNHVKEMFLKHDSSSAQRQMGALLSNLWEPLMTKLKANAGNMAVNLRTNRQKGIMTVLFGKRIIDVASVVIDANQNVKFVQILSPKGMPEWCNDTLISNAIAEAQAIIDDRAL